MLWENSSKGILMVEKIISSVVFIVWGGVGGKGGSVGEGGGEEVGELCSTQRKVYRKRSTTTSTIHHCAAASKV